MSVIICPTDCSNLPDVSFNECAPELHYGEVTKIYLAKSIAADFSDWTDLAEWTARLVDTGGDDDSIRTLIVMGDLPASESTEIPLTGDRIAKGFKRWRLAFDIDETNDVNYDVLKYFDCDGSYKMWFETSDGMLYGGNTGHERVYFTLDNIIPRSREELVKFTGQATWRAKTVAERTISPMY